jgi:2-amino-4-hydroxy-6-hydroxymethyldihydropteridine diphosphokinase
MHQVVFLIGGNEGDREYLIGQALNLISGLGKLLKVSSIYESQAWGDRSEGNFLNQALLLETSKSPEDALRATQKIEKTLGRTRHQHWGNRTMDIDLIYYDDQVFQTKNLIIPHPLMSERRFVLVPLTEILPDFVHPVFRLSNQKLLEICTDSSEVRIY